MLTTKGNWMGSTGGRGWVWTVKKTVEGGRPSSKIATRKQKSAIGGGLPAAEHQLRQEGACRVSVWEEEEHGSQKEEGSVGQRGGRGARRDDTISKTPEEGQ